MTDHTSKEMYSGRVPDAAEMKARVDGDRAALEVIDRQKAEIRRLTGQLAMTNEMLCASQDEREWLRAAMIEARQECIDGHVMTAIAELDAGLAHEPGDKP